MAGPVNSAKHGHEICSFFVRRVASAMFSSLRLPSAKLAARSYSTQQPKASVKLVAELRKLTDVSISKAREALVATNNDVGAALEWLQKDLVTTGAKKAAKVQGRSTNQGLISVSVLKNGAGTKTQFGGVRAAMIELNCETDFVGRNDLFGRLAGDIAHTAAYMAETSSSPNTFQLFPSILEEAPLLSKDDPSSVPSGTVASAIRDAIAKLGENITLRRAVTVVENSPRQTDLSLGLASYVHGSVNDTSQGRIGALALLALKSQKVPELLALEAFQDDLGRLERAIARQIVGFETYTIEGNGANESALYDQPFMMLGGDYSDTPVRDALVAWSQQKGLISHPSAGEGVKVLDFVKWAVGEPIDAVPEPHI